MLADVNLLYANSVQYNGESHSITSIAAKIVQTCKEQFEEHAEQFDILEKNLELQAMGLGKVAEQQLMDDDWQQMVTTESTSNFAFTGLMEGNFLIRYYLQKNFLDRKHRFTFIMNVSYYKQFIFSFQILEPDDNNDLKSPTALGMSLETFISRDLLVMEQAMVEDQKEDDDYDEAQGAEGVTTEDILGMKTVFLFEKKNFNGYIEFLVLF